MGKEEFVGTWKLVSAEYRFADGERSKLYDAGILMYDAHGNMSVQLMQHNRPAFAKSDRLGGTLEEIRSAFQGYLAYYGTYTIDEMQGAVTHHLEGALLPNWVGVDQVRFFELVANRLTLRTPPLLMRGKDAVGYLVWQRTK
jgi:Lipocalin-like domain